MNRSESIIELATALAKAQGEIKEAPKDNTNPHFGSRYADLASVWEVIRAPFSKNGLSVLQIPSNLEDGSISLETMLLHSSGQYVSEVLTMQPKDKSPQAAGSTITYLRRYALMGFGGVAPGDDDGNAGTFTGPPGSQKKHVEQPKSGPKPTIVPKSVEGNNPQTGAVADKPKLANTAAAPTTITKADLDYLKTTYEAHGWNSSEVADYMDIKFKKTKLSEYSREEYDELVFVIKNMSPIMALGEANAQTGDVS